ncbi:hypothetical protein RERY_43100 [Rhodococcus erythropolis]|nr:hypothetical protein RERY_43100 [Rhodococcus erythropolis]
MCPACGDHRDSTSPDTLHAIAVSSLVRTPAIHDQNARSRSLRTGGRPGDRITAGRSMLPFILVVVPSFTSVVEVLRLSVEPGQYTSIAFAEMPAVEGVAASISSAGDAYDHALAESTSRLLKGGSRFHEQSVSARPDQDDRRHRILGRWSGWIGSIPVACTAPWATSLLTSSRPSITLHYRFSSRRCRQHRSGKKPGTVHGTVCAALCETPEHAEITPVPKESQGRFAQSDRCA